MSLIKKPRLTLFCLLFVSFSHAQKQVVYYYSEVGLTLYISSDFKVLSAASNDSLNKKGLKYVEDANHVTPDISQTKTLIAARKNDFDYFNVTITPYDLIKDGSYPESVQSVNIILYNTIKSKLPNGKIDTATGVKTVGSISFTEFRMKIKLTENKTMNMYMLSTYYKGYDLGISYLYMDDLTKKQMETILNSMKFSR